MTLAKDEEDHLVVGLFLFVAFVQRMKKESLFVFFIEALTYNTSHL